MYMNTRLISINPWLYTKSGHNLIYIQSVEKAVTKLGWSFVALLPQKNILKSLPENWSKCFDCPTVRHWFEKIEKKPYKRERKFIRAKQRIRYYISLYRSIKRNLIQGNNILFLETFAISDIKLLANLISFLPRKKLQVWLLYRYPSSFMKKEIELFKQCHEKIRKNGVELRLISDSEPLSEDLSVAFQENVHTFPIPHVEGLDSIPSLKKDRIQCWWPGFPREGKGQKIIQNFSKSSHPKNSLFQLLAAKSTRLTSHEMGPRVLELSNELSRKEYLDHFNNSDLILLPYTDPHYEKSTSGIFVEAVMAGKIPVVYQNTWMAYELHRFSLENLIIDWSEDTLAKKLEVIYNDKSTRKKLESMKKIYLEYHSLDSFSETIHKLAHV